MTSRLLGNDDVTVAISRGCDVALDFGSTNAAYFNCQTLLQCNATDLIGKRTSAFVAS